MEPERRYALDALLDALGLPFDEGVRVPDDAVLDEVFGLLTLAHERDAELDQHGRPLPARRPARAAGRRARGRARARAARLPRRRALPGRAHPRRRPARRGRAARPRHASWPARSRTARGGACSSPTTFAADAIRGRDPDYPLEALVAAEADRGSTCFFLTRQEAPQDGYPERYGPALARRGRAHTGRPGIEVALHASYRARERPGAIAEEAPPARRGPGPAPPLPAQRPGPAGGGAARGRPALRLEHRLALAAGAAGRDAVPVPALGSRAARAGRLGAAARPDGRDAGRGALPRARRRSRIRGRDRRAGAGRRARRRGRDPLASALASSRGSRTATTGSTGGCWRGSTSAAAGREARPRRSTAGRRAGPRLRRSRRLAPASRARRRSRAAARVASRTGR